MDLWEQKVNNISLAWFIWSTGNTRPWSAGSAMELRTQTAALHYGGNPAGAVSTTASYDGTGYFFYGYY